MRQYLDRLAAEDDRRDPVAAVRGYDDQISAFRRRAIDNRPIVMLMLGLDHLARNSCCFRYRGDGAKSFFGMPRDACFVRSRRVLDHLRIGRERMKGGKTVRTMTLAPIRLA
jgi:hypothetical protein